MRKEEKALKTALNKLKKCNGDCKHCKKCHIYCGNVENGIAYAFGCDELPNDMFGALAESMSELHGACVDQLLFELR